MREEHGLSKNKNDNPIVTTQKRSTFSSSGCAMSEMERNGEKSDGENERKRRGSGFYDSDEERDPPCTSDL